MSTEKPIKIYLKDAIYVPMRRVTDEHMEKVVERWEKHVYMKEITCEKCEYFSERPSDACSGCQNYKGLKKLHQQTTLKVKGDAIPMLRVPYGDRVGVKKIFGDVKIIDKTPEIPMRRKFELTVPLKPDQIPAVKAMMKTRSGVLKSPPRSGKTVMGAAYIAKMGLKTLIIAAQQDWLDNFLETFIGSDTQPAMTNISKKRVGMAKKLEEFEKYDVALCTYHTFISDKGKKLLEKVKKMFSVVIVDEVQGTAALEFSRVISNINAKYKFGLSGTPERKDTLEWVIYKIFGKVFYENKVSRLRPRVEVVEPPLVPKLPNSWTYAVGALEKHPKRLKHIAETAIKDMKAGHTVLIPMARVPVVNALVQAINMMLGKKRAAAFHGQVKKSLRKTIVDQARNRKIRILVGNSRLLSTGINIPVASMLYQVSPSSNIPKADQRFSRILTPHDDKPQPVVKYWLDDLDLVRTCMRNEHFGCLVPVFKPIIDPRTKARLDHYFKGNRKRFKEYDSNTSGFI